MTAGRGRPPSSRRCPAAPAGTCPCPPASRSQQRPRSPPRSGAPPALAARPEGLACVPAGRRAPAPAPRPFLAGRPSRPQAVAQPSRHRQLGAASLAASDLPLLDCCMCPAASRDRSLGRGLPGCEETCHWLFVPAPTLSLLFVRGIRTLPTRPGRCRVSVHRVGAEKTASARRVLRHQ